MNLLVGLVLFRLLALHGADGREIDINPAEITSLREAQAKPEHFTEGLHCLINTTDGKFIAVKESCATIRRMMEKDGGD